MKLNLNGKWEFRERGGDNWIPAQIPGCNFTDLMDNGIIPDPFIGLNEEKVQWIGEREWEYRRQFDVKEELLSSDRIELVMESLDTLASVYVNGNPVLESDNAHRTYIVDIKQCLKAGENTILILFRSPVEYIREGHRKVKYPFNNMGLQGVPHIRKPQCHFGWDWGPVLPLSGIMRDIYIKGYNKAKILDVRVLQEHEGEKVSLDVAINAEIMNEKDTVNAKVVLTAPNGTKSEYLTEIKGGEGKIRIDIIDPEIWEANGMSERKTQPLYQLTIALISGGTEADSRQINIGLRTITLNTAADQYGNNFQFVVNGVPIFCRGANWIPADSFVNRLTIDRIDSLVRSMRDANMNMVRVWGGGYYESDDFYDACDRYGLLVWQDFAFACMPYDFTNQTFLNNIKYEVKDNVLRLRDRASLALWSGNNEIELLSKIWIYRRDFIRSAGEFFYNILPQWVDGLDGVTPYWNGSPSSGRYMRKVNADTVGDTHLWQVWHGLKPYNYYRKRFTRFCSEFGFESMPDIETVEKFAEEKDYDMSSAVMQSHQKCKSGNNKILFYLAGRFRIPDNFKDLIYLSQISQAECVRDATEHWRRNFPRCNGALYWQYNDCWPVNSWSGMDYYGRWKALMYAAKKFNAPIALSIDDNKTLMKVSLVNDTVKEYKGTLHWQVITFDGNKLDGGSLEINSSPLSAEKVFEKDFRHLVKGLEKRTVFCAWIDERDIKTALFVKEKQCQFLKSEIVRDIKVKGGKAEITLKADDYKRFVMVKVDGAKMPLSDNYFDLLPKEVKTITADVGNIKAEEVKIELLCVNDIVPRQSKFRDKLFRLKIRLIPVNILFAIGQLFS